ncbi:Zn-ribbon domain-containing OB-fold protein [Halorussus amylolyticus]|uniref:Zn-ribbon domain-containing OB-fold protein n=1 Tax=Halorussus amylolyticus TaxID=1126242 RepID=UPI001050D14A|nr:Zn-ribbon domain-containing OB-fold protein [Halorussus amylolyticus]
MSQNDDEVRDDGFDDFLDAIEDGEGFYLECPDGHGSLPPRRVCPHCGQGDLSEVALPESGEIETFTVVHVPAPEFADDAPYATAVVDFGPVRLTGQILDVAPEETEVGATVTPVVAETATTGERVLAFRPR